MWIKYICLENFKNIKTGLKANRLEIDFSKRENVICLLTGPNGMGKTSLLSCLTPFATLGNLDIRDGNQLIIEKKPGYKRIIIMNGPDEIDIEHFYSVNKETHSVKSYIKLNGKELNPNGNVTSFKNVVYELLHIDLDYVRLIRLGDNVSNLIQLKTSERKKFMSKMLPSVDNYLKLYTKLSADVRDLKVVMSHITDNINKLNIKDEEEYQKKMNEIDDAISYYEKNINEVTEEIYKLTYDIESLSLDLEYRDELRKLRKKESRYRLLLEDKDSLKDIDTLKKEIESLSQMILKLKSEIEFSDREYDMKLNQLDDNKKEISELSYQIDIEVQNSNLLSLRDYLKELLEKEQKTKAVTLPFEINFTKEELDDFVVDLKNIQRDLNITYEFGKGPITEVIDLMEKDVNISDFVTANLLALENKREKSNRTYLDSLITKYEKKKIPDCKESCIFRDLYMDVMRVKEIKSVETSNKSPEYYQIVKVVHENLLSIIERLSELSGFIKKLPAEYQSMFIKKKVFKSIKKCEMIYKDEKINELMSIVAEYSYYIKLNQEIETTKKNIESEEQKSNLPFLVKQKEKLEDKNQTLLDEIEALKEKMNSLSKELKEKEEELELSKDSIGAIENYTTIKDNMIELEEKAMKYEEWSKERLEKEKKKNVLTHEKTFMINNKNQYDMNFQEFKKLTKELRKCREMYDDYLLIRSATSTKEGIPLLHIQMYLKDTKELVNELLDIVYDGKIYIDDFSITGDEFKIPFIKEGTEIPDISFASQGEKSFLNMAISFALSIQNLTEYNIPLLDEVDATFDQENREKAIAIIERQNEIIQSEQTFIISHNNMYNQYPVDVIDFSDLKSSKFDIKLS